MESSFPPVQAGGSEALMPLSATAALAYPEGSDQGGGQERAGDRDQQDPAERCRRGEDRSAEQETASGTEAARAPGPAGAQAAHHYHQA